LNRLKSTTALETAPAGFCPRFGAETLASAAGRARSGSGSKTVVALPSAASAPRGAGAGAGAARFGFVFIFGVGRLGRALDRPVLGVRLVAVRGGIVVVVAADRLRVARRVYEFRFVHHGFRAPERDNARRRGGRVAKHNLACRVFRIQSHAVDVHAELGQVAHGDASSFRVHRERGVRAADGGVVGDVHVAVLAADREPAREGGQRRTRGFGCQHDSDRAAGTVEGRAYRADAYFCPGTRGLTIVSSPTGRCRWYGMVPPSVSGRGEI
jgi:hypothetical protein